MQAIPAVKTTYEPVPRLLLMGNTQLQREPHRPPRRPAARRPERQQRRGHVHHSDPLEDTGEAKMLRSPEHPLPKRRIHQSRGLSPPEEGERIEQKAEEDDEQAAPDDPDDDVAPARAT